MNIVSVDDTLLSDDVMQQASFINAEFFEDVAEHNYKRFLLSGVCMGALARFVWSNDTNTSLQKGLYMALSTLLSDLALGVGVKMGYLDNKNLLKLCSTTSSKKSGLIKLACCITSSDKSVSSTEIIFIYIL